MPIVPIQPALGTPSGPDPTLTQRHPQQIHPDYHHPYYPQQHPLHPYSTVPVAVPVPGPGPGYYHPSHATYDLPPVRDNFGGSNNSYESSFDSNSSNSHLYQHYYYTQQHHPHEQQHPQEYHPSSRHSSPESGPESSSHLDRSGTPDSVTADGSHHDKTPKGKLFQCTGFGDCRMVFTRSEHLARHARKHTGEKPFKCVVDGCTRMFSRFDNMVQHTQTHTKGSNRESADLIASKIAIETRRKSEAGLLAGTTTRRPSTKASKANRNSMTVAPSVDNSASSKHQRTPSLPVLSVAPAGPIRSITPALPSPVTPSSMAGSPNSPSKLLRAGAKKDNSKIRKKSTGSNLGRRGSLGSVADSNSTESWYGSKLHHRTSLDFSLDHRAYLASMQAANNNQRHDRHLPPMHQYISEQDHPMGQSTYVQSRHPLSPEHSSEDMDSDDASLHVHRQQARSELSTPDQGWRNVDVDDSMAHCTLPPLRTVPGGVTDPSARVPLPSIQHAARYRSQTIHSGSNRLPEPYPPNKLRRLSLVDLNAPIQEATKAVHHSVPVPRSGQQKTDGVDVSEDEIKALEAFGELWSQGRDVEMKDSQASSLSPQPKIKLESPPESSLPYDEQVPGPDFGRRTLSPSNGNGIHYYGGPVHQVQQHRGMEVD
ncbi:C2H2 transcription facotor [Entomortierella parvispora]|uniref:C2H2 transcription facotor n=2 Tax=Mortierellaceae TaxID=4854 RepID=A0A9P3HA82_9FUNG|nr:C2H2 transcription facotor [Entomortierella parvispora]